MPKEVETEEPDGELEDLDALDDAEIDGELEEDIDDEDALVVDGDDDDDDALIEVDVLEVDEAGAEEAEPAEARPAEADDDDIDELVNEDDVEESLDEILKSRMVVEDEPEDDEGVDVEDRTEKPDAVLPKQADEFRCSNCFLIKKTSQLADPKRNLCRDCV
jgi:hypothetical protein